MRTLLARLFYPQPQVVGRGEALKLLLDKAGWKPSPPQGYPLQGRMKA